MSDDLDFMPAAPSSGSDKPASGSDKSGLGSDKPAAAAKPEKSTPKSSALAVPEQGGDAPPGARADLPTWNRSRRKRNANVKAEKQDDAFQRGVRQAGRRVIDTPKLVIGAIVIAVAAIGGGVALHNSRLEKNAEATRVLHGATSAIVRGQVIPAETQAEFADNLRFIRAPVYATAEEREAAIDEALTAARSSGRDDVEQNAALVAATRAVRAGDFEAAISEYDGLLAEIGGDHPLRFIALEGKGIALEGNEQYEEALAVFATIAPNPTDFYRPMALYHQGRVLEALGRKDEALAIYEQYFQEFPPAREEMATPMVRKRVEALDPEFAARLTAPPAMPDFSAP